MLYLLIDVNLLTWDTQTARPVCDQTTAVEFTVEAAKAQAALEHGALVYQVSGTGIKQVKRVATFQITTEDVVVSKAPEPPAPVAPSKQKKEHRK